MMKNILLIGKKSFVIEEAKRQIRLPDINFYTSTNIEDVRSVFEQNEIHHVIMGAGIELASRLEMIDTIYRLSESTTIHMKDVSSGPQGFYPFVSAMLSGLKTLS